MHGPRHPRKPASPPRARCYFTRRLRPTIGTMSIVSQRLEIGPWPLDAHGAAARPRASARMGRGSVWDFDGTLSNPWERVFPNGMLELIVQLDDLHLDVLETETALTPAT